VELKLKCEDSILAYDINVVIVKYGMGSKVITFAKEYGISGGTVILGKGTVKNSILKFLELAENHKEIVLILSDRAIGNSFLEKANRYFNFTKPNSGICFSIPVTSILGTPSTFGDVRDIIESEGEDMVLYNSIFVIVDRGLAEQVVEAANESGARGGTIINARGSGTHETSKLFAIEIEPEKELVLILVESSITDAVCENIREKTGINEPGKGILFVQKVNKAYGLY
jgi:nitrogen regulatory protein PII